MQKLDVLNTCLICSLALRNRDELTESRHSFPNKDVTMPEWKSYEGINERMLEIKALN